MYKICVLYTNIQKEYTYSGCDFGGRLYCVKSQTLLWATLNLLSIYNIGLDELKME